MITQQRAKQAHALVIVTLVVVTLVTVTLLSVHAIQA